MCGVCVWFAGGDVAFSQAGRDATDAFNMFHPPSASHWLKRFRIGKLRAADRGLATTKGETDTADTTVPASTSTPPTKSTLPPKTTTTAGGIAFTRAYRQLLRSFRTQGLLNANLWFYCWKFLSTVAIGALACSLVLCFESVWLHLAGAFVLALFWQQCGWMSHDFCHHQVRATSIAGD